MWLNPQETTDLVKFTKEFLNGKVYFFIQIDFQVLWTAARITIFNSKYDTDQTFT